MPEITVSLTENEAYILDRIVRMHSYVRNREDAIWWLINKETTNPQSVQEHMRFLEWEEAFRNTIERHNSED